MKQRWFVVIPLFALLYLAGSAPAQAREPLRYRQDIRPILATNCLSCHGQDEHKRAAGLRLDQPNRAVVPGDILASALAQRIHLPQSRAAHMPPADSGHTLTAAEQQRLLRWIGEGARYEGHWSFSPLSPAPGTIDTWIAARLKQVGLSFSPEADRWTLARRVALDLTGLPPTLPETEAFVHDTRPDAYERYVDRLLASPHYGEKQARLWLDLARYADSSGYGSDPLRPNLWPWRDWVINAFNTNMPFDQFTLEQLAGDLLPNATEAQKIATAFHRNTMTNTEGGTDDEEFRIAAVKDRTIVTMQVWMGLTFQCAQCHTHKFDPISKTDFYRLMAIFNQTEDNDQPDERPTLAVLAPAQRARKQALEAEAAALEKRQASEPVGTLPVARYVRVTQPGKDAFLMLAEVQVQSQGENLARKGRARQSSTDYGGAAERAVDGNTSGSFPENSVTHTAQETDPWWEVDLGRAAPIETITLWPRTDAHVGRFRDCRITLYDSEHRPLTEQVVPGALTAARAVALSDSETGRKRAAVQAALAALKPVPLPILKELPAERHRVSHALTLGNFLLPEEAVTAAGPVAFTRQPIPDRLALARWLVSKQNPLTARVTVNRYWAQLFGTGLVETEEDFGTQGASPSHPELLDALARDFQTDWNIKRLLRRLVLSRTYRQSSRTTPERLARDPRARLLSRYPRRRLDAEGVRDQALVLSGLLAPQLGGPSVFPPQPDGLWRAAFNGERTYPTSTGADRYRRGLYTFWRRTVPYPSLQVFDAPSREFCTVRRLPTNTPLQALVTLNDPAYLELAVGLAKRLMAEGGSTPAARAAYGLRLALCRPPDDVRIAPLLSLFVSERAHYAAVPEQAKKLTGSDDPELAAWTVVSNILLNLDGVLTKG